MAIQISAIFNGIMDEMEVPSEMARKLRRADEFIRLGVLAGHQIFQQYRAEDSKIDDSCGLVLGSIFGPMETNFEVLDQVVAGEQASPTLFSHSVFNSAAGYMASTLGIKGCGLTITDFDFPFFRALEQGCLTLLSGRMKLCLVLQVESYSKLLQDALLKHAPGVVPWKPEVACWLLEKTNKRDDEEPEIISLRIDANYQDREEYLQWEERLVVGDSVTPCSSPLDAAREIGKKLQSTEKDSGLNCRIESRYGSVHLVIQG